MSDPSIRNTNNAAAIIGYGKDYNFYYEGSVSSSHYGTDGYSISADGYFDGYDANVVSRIIGQIPQIKFTVSAGADVYVSFNGTTNHLHLVNDTSVRKEFIYPHLQKTKFWFKGTATRIEIEYYV